MEIPKTCEVCKKKVLIMFKKNMDVMYFGCSYDNVRYILPYSKYFSWMTQRHKTCPYDEQEENSKPPEGK
jgi:hypothetical protein